MHPCKYQHPGALHYQQLHPQCCALAGHWLLSASPRHCDHTMQQYECAGKYQLPSGVRRDEENSGPSYLFTCSFTTANKYWYKLPVCKPTLLPNQAHWNSYLCWSFEGTEETASYKNAQAECYHIQPCSVPKCGRWPDGGSYLPPDNKRLPWGSSVQLLHP